MERNSKSNSKNSKSKSTKTVATRKTILTSLFIEIKQGRKKWTEMLFQKNFLS